MPYVKKVVQLLVAGVVLGVVLLAVRYQGYYVAQQRVLNQMPYVKQFSQLQDAEEKALAKCKDLACVKNTAVTTPYRLIDKDIAYLKFQTEANADEVLALRKENYQQLAFRMTELQQSVLYLNIKDANAACLKVWLFPCERNDVFDTLENHYQVLTKALAPVNNMAGLVGAGQ